MTDKFSLLSSLINAKPAVVEALEAPQAARTQDTIEVGDVNLAKRPTSDDSIKCEIWAQYEDVQGETYSLTVHAMLHGDFSVEDDSFGYEHGSERGTHEDVYNDISDLHFKSVSVPHVPDNLEVHRLEPQKFNHVVQTVKSFFEGMDHEEVKGLVDMEKLSSIMFVPFHPD
jgi:hypothetical protein